MDSPFARHLHTNYVPSDTEVKCIEEHLLPHRLELLRLERLIQDLCSQRTKILHYINVHKALISPARRLPADIVQEIFLACLPTQRNSVMSSKDAPLILTRICSGWRAVALSTPALWASLHLPLEFIFQKNLKTPVIEWLERAGRHPLSLSIMEPPNLALWENTAPNDVEAVVGGLIHRADRWHAVELSVHSASGLRLFGAVKAAALRAVTLKPSVYDLGDLGKINLLTTPTLRAVTIALEEDFDRIVPPLPLPWEHLTSLTVQSMGHYYYQGLSADITLMILKRCPRLIHFEADIINTSILAPAMPILLAALQTFIFRSHSSINAMSVTHLLQQLLMPELRRIRLPRIADTGPLSAVTFLGHLGVRSSLLEELDVDLAGLAQDSLIENLLLLPYLTKLVVFECGSVQAGFDTSHYNMATVGQLLAALAPEYEPESDLVAPQLCPLLRELQLKECRALPGAEAELLAFARRRLDLTTSSDPTRFNRLEVEYTDVVSPIEADVLASFAARGLTISKRYTLAGPSSAATAWTGVDP
ncbi:hypothetical protein B0H19DRAFT_987847 [Mycena capillaripes]|nr:hypothetical protein B0H19DRAFT_987847 [Mycena capillaripes]